MKGKKQEMTMFESLNKGLTHSCKLIAHPERIVDEKRTKMQDKLGWRVVWYRMGFKKQKNRTNDHLIVNPGGRGKTPPDQLVVFIAVNDQRFKLQCLPVIPPLNQAKTPTPWTTKDRKSEPEIYRVEAGGWNCSFSSSFCPFF
ncbi:hypothetical protein HPP92_013706 [Vanilla planifolia]|uniref:Uncharacterized protein n=1 Tax=Vanilla planifolia TaxID=51239 RepID=A0A835UYQ7_VANPL|nr:hypothetical protein HPP92_013706 [Vanilla planifolia]